MAMNIGNLNNFIESYRGSADRARKIADENAQKAATAIAFQPIDTPPPPVVPARTAPPPNPMAALAAMGGPGGPPPASGGPTASPLVSGPTGAPAAPGGGGLPPQAMALLAKLIPPGGQGAPGGTPPMPGGMKPMAQPPASPVPPPGQGNVPQPGPTASPPSDMGGGVSDPVKEATAWLTSTFKGLKQQNPQASPYVLSLAVEKRIEAMKGIAPITKAAMQGQVEVMKNQTRAQQVLMKYEYDMQRAKTAEEVAQANRDYKTGMVEAYTGRTAEMEMVGMDRNQATRESAATRAGATRDAASIRADASKAVQGMKPGPQREKAIIDGVAKITAAAAMTGADPSDDIKAFKREIASTGTGGGGAAPQRYTRGGTGAAKPSPADIAYVKANPGSKASFIAHFGKAAADAAGIK